MYVLGSSNFSTCLYLHSAHFVRGLAKFEMGRLKQKGTIYLTRPAVDLVVHDTQIDAIYSIVYIATWSQYGNGILLLTISVNNPCCEIEPLKLQQTVANGYLADYAVLETCLTMDGSTFSWQSRAA